MNIDLGWIQQHRTNKRLLRQQDLQRRQLQNLSRRVTHLEERLRALEREESNG